MSDENTRTKLLAAAHTLRLKDPDHFSVAALCRNTGLSRSKVRRYFLTKSELIAALTTQTTVGRSHQKPRPTVPLIEEDWIESRFKVFERALSILEAKAEETVREHSRTISQLEQKFSIAATTSSAATEHLPSLEASAPIVLGPGVENQTVTANRAYLLPESLWIFANEGRKPRPRTMALLEESFAIAASASLESADLPPNVEAPVEQELRTSVEDQTHSAYINYAHSESCVDSTNEFWKPSPRTITSLEESSAIAASTSLEAADLPPIPEPLASPEPMLGVEDQAHTAYISYAHPEPCVDSTKEFWEPGPHTISPLEECSAIAATASLAAADLPPIIEPLASREPMLDVEYQADLATSYDIQAESLLASTTEIHQPKSLLRVREALRHSTEEAQRSESSPPRYMPNVFMRVSPKVIVFAAAMIATLAFAAQFFKFGSPAHAKQTPITSAEQSLDRPHDVIVIDAADGAPDPGYHQVNADIRNLIERAEAGDAHAQSQLGLSFMRGEGVSEDPVAAARWIDEAAAQGEPTAEFTLGTLYAEGIKPNPELAFQWYSVAASGGNVKAMHNLGVALLEGAGIAKDPVTAVKWFTRAAMGGYVDSAFDLGVLYERGEGVAQDPQNALKWYDDAASLGDSEAAQRATLLRTQLSQFSEK